MKEKEVKKKVGKKEGVKKSKKKKSLTWEEKLAILDENFDFASAFAPDWEEKIFYGFAYEEIAPYFGWEVIDHTYSHIETYSDGYTVSQEGDDFVIKEKTGTYTYGADTFTARRDRNMLDYKKIVELENKYNENKKTIDMISNVKTVLRMIGWGAFAFSFVVVLFGAGAEPLLIVLGFAVFIGILSLLIDRRKNLNEKNNLILKRAKKLCNK